MSSWRGLRPSFTDGICHKCAALVRADHLRSRDRGAGADRRNTAWMPGLLAVSLSIVLGLVLVARPTHEPPPLSPVVAVLPPAPVDAPTETPPVEEPRAEAEAPAATSEPLFVQPSAASPRRVKWVPAASRPSRRQRPVTESSTLSRVATRVAWAPYQTVLSRESTQSP